MSCVEQRQAEENIVVGIQSSLFQQDGRIGDQIGIALCL